MKKLNEEARSAVMRCITHELYIDATEEDIAEACETSVAVVRAVMEELRLRYCLTHARLISEQLHLGLDDRPDAVITMALEHFYEAQKKSPRLVRDMKWFLKRTT